MSLPPTFPLQGEQGWMLFAVLVLPSIPPVWGQCLFCEIIREAFKYCLADFVQRGVLWYFSFLPVFSTTWNWHAVWPYGQHSVKVGKTPQEVTSSPVSKWPVWEIMVMIKIKIMTKVWTTRNLAMLITIMVLVMLAMILLITERELSKYLVEGGIHLWYVGRLMLEYIIIWNTLSNDMRLCAICWVSILLRMGLICDMWEGC